MTSAASSTAAATLSIFAETDGQSMDGLGIAASSAAQSMGWSILSSGSTIKVMLLSSLLNVMQDEDFIPDSSRRKILSFSRLKRSQFSSTVFNAKIWSVSSPPLTFSRLTPSFPSIFIMECIPKASAADNKRLKSLTALLLTSKPGFTSLNLPRLLATTCLSGEFFNHASMGKTVSKSLNFTRGRVSSIKPAISAL